MRSNDFFRSVAASRGADAGVERPGQPTVTALTNGTGNVGAHEADVMAQSFTQSLSNLGPHLGPHAAYPLLTTPRTRYSDKLGTEGEINGSLGGIKAKVVFGYQPEGDDPINGPSPQVNGDESHQAASNLAPGENQAVGKHGVVSNGVVNL